RPAIPHVAENGGTPSVTQPPDNGAKDSAVVTPPAEPKSTEKENAAGTSKPTPPRVSAPKTQVATALTPAQLVPDAEQKYLAAIAQVSRDVNKHRSQLDPMVLARFDASLSEIDRTIKETRQVVRQNPEDPIALQYLLAAYSKKVDVLREMTND